MLCRKVGARVFFNGAAFQCPIRCLSGQQFGNSATDRPISRGLSWVRFPDWPATLAVAPYFDGRRKRFPVVIAQVIAARVLPSFSADRVAAFVPSGAFRAQVHYNGQRFVFRKRFAGLLRLSRSDPRGLLLGIAAAAFLFAAVTLLFELLLEGAISMDGCVA